MVSSFLSTLYIYFWYWPSIICRVDQNLFTFCSLPPCTSDSVLDLTEASQFYKVTFIDFWSYACTISVLFIKCSSIINSTSGSGGKEGEMKICNQLTWFPGRDGLWDSRVCLKELEAVSVACSSDVLTRNKNISYNV